MGGKLEVLVWRIITIYYRKLGHFKTHNWVMSNTSHSTKKAEAGGSLEARSSRPVGQHRETTSHKEGKKKRKKGKEEGWEGRRKGEREGGRKRGREGGREEGRKLGREAG
jgi:hypothetical protein